MHPLSSFDFLPRGFEDVVGVDANGHGDGE